MAIPTTEQAIALLQRGQTAAAAAAFAQVLQARPSDALAHAGLGHCLMRLGREDEAWQSLDTACRLSDQIGQAFSDRAWLALRRDEPVVALHAAERALALNPADAAAHQYALEEPPTIAADDSAEMAFERANAEPLRRLVVLGDGDELLGLVCLNSRRTHFCGGPKTEL